MFCFFSETVGVEENHYHAWKRRKKLSHERKESHLVGPVFGNSYSRNRKQTLFGPLIKDIQRWNQIIS